MLDLLKWRTHPDKITGCLSKLKEIDGSEIVKVHGARHPLGSSRDQGCLEGRDGCYLTGSFPPSFPDSFCKTPWIPYSEF